MRFNALRFLMFSITAVVLAASGCRETPSRTTPSGTPADAIYFGGNIITINDKQPTAEAVAIGGGRILAVGNKTDIENAYTVKDRDKDMINLGGKTLLPGFVDGHSHIFQVAYAATFVNLLPPPDGPTGAHEIKSVKNITDALKAYLENNQNPKPTVIVGNGYDDSMLKEKKHPTRSQLDEVSNDIPVYIIHQSGHYGVANTAALEKAKITKGGKIDKELEEEELKGGTIYRYEGTDEPNGLMGEAANVWMLTNLGIPMLDAEMLKAGEDRYTSQGFTTVQDGRITADGWESIEKILKNFSFRIDVAAYVDAQTLAAWMNDPKHQGKLPADGKFGRAYDDRRFRVAGVKLTLDGSPQGRSAWLRKPYFKAPEGQVQGYKGQPNIPPDEVKKLIADAYKNGRQVIMHTNGDAAIDELIEAVKATSPRADHRTVLVHGQFLQPDQIGDLKTYGIFPSIFPMHTFYWGDWYRSDVVGKTDGRAEFISPTKAVLLTGMKFSIHSDAPVTFPNSMRILDSAVNRTTRTGYELGADQRISPIVALKAMTLWPAYQHFEESTKGSIEAGKLADFVILCENPLTVERKKLYDIRVYQTIKEGTSVYGPAPCSQP